MGKRGPAPTPSKLKLLKGTFRKDRAPKREPTPPKGHPACPPGLGRMAKAEWRRIVPILDGMGILSTADRSTIAAYCQTWQFWQELVAMVEEHGHTMVTDKGFVMARPEVTLAAKQAALLRQLAGELGLTPSARSRVEVPEKTPPKDATEELLFGKRRGA